MPNAAHREPLAALDALTDQLPERAAHLATRVDRVLASWSQVSTDRLGRLLVAGEPVCPVCLTGPCDCLIDYEAPRVLAATNGGERVVVCVWCMEPTGFCRATGGRRPCEGQSDQAALMAEIADAPTIHIGGAR